MSDPLSLYTLYIEQVLPYALFEQSARTPFFICNAFTLRTELYAGRVTRNDIFSIDPFAETYAFLPGVQGSMISKLVSYLGAAPPSLLRRLARERRVHEREVEAAVAAGLPQFFHSQLDLQPGTAYDLVFSGYDGVVISQTLGQLFPATNFTVQAYNTNVTSTACWIDYISAKFKC
eukprot:TRINITY_DN4872_c0_g1_i1.p2 TRINITY_DN4872_c0_g1~~TRINITY_DN4872_c0_g1_i1.p2  ORF type:complete len:176 (+),score=80.74 TRINITY_DN4872_c0_g1_i1:203-730(+)